MEMISESDLKALKEGDPEAASRIHALLLGDGQKRICVETLMKDLADKKSGSIERIVERLNRTAIPQESIEAVWKALIEAAQDHLANKPQSIGNLLSIGVDLTYLAQEPQQRDAHSSLFLLSVLPLKPKIMPEAYIMIIGIGATLSSIASGEHLSGISKDWYFERSRKALVHAIGAMNKEYARLTEEAWLENDAGIKRRHEKSLRSIEQNVIHITSILGYFQELEGKEELDAIMRGSGPMSQRVIDAAGENRGRLRSLEERESASGQREELLSRYSHEGAHRESMFISTIYRAIDQVYSAIERGEDGLDAGLLLPVKQITRFGVKSGSDAERRISIRDREDMRHDIINALAQATMSREAEVRAEALEGLALLGGRRVEYVIEKMVSREKDEERQGELYRTLGRIRSAQRVQESLSPPSGALKVPRPSQRSEEASERTGTGRNIVKNKA